MLVHSRLPFVKKHLSSRTGGRVMAMVRPSRLLLNVGRTIHEVFSPTLLPLFIRVVCVCQSVADRFRELSRYFVFILVSFYCIYSLWNHEAKLQIGALFFFLNDVWSIFGALSLAISSLFNSLSFN